MKRILLILSIYASSVFSDNSNTKTEIYTQIVNKLPESFCKSNILKCSKVELNECKILIKYFSQACFYKFENKITNNISLEGLSKVGNEIGQCTGATFEMILTQAKQIDTSCLKELK